MLEVMSFLWCQLLLGIVTLYRHSLSSLFIVSWYRHSWSSLFIVTLHRQFVSSIGIVTLYRHFSSSIYIVTLHRHTVQKSKWQYMGPDNCGERYRCSPVLDTHSKSRWLISFKFCMYTLSHLVVPQKEWEFISTCRVFLYCGFQCFNMFECLIASFGGLRFVVVCCFRCCILIGLIDLFAFVAKHAFAQCTLSMVVCAFWFVWLICRICCGHAFAQWWFAFVAV